METLKCLMGICITSWICYTSLLDCYLSAEGHVKKTTQLCGAIQY